MLGELATVFGGTAAGAALGDHAVLAGAVLTAGWVAGTWRGLRLVRLAQQGACPLRPTGTPQAFEDMTFGPADPTGLARFNQQGENMTEHQRTQ